MEKEKKKIKKGLRVWEKRDRLTNEKPKEVRESGRKKEREMVRQTERKWFWKRENNDKRDVKKLYREGGTNEKKKRMNKER